MIVDGKSTKLQPQSAHVKPDRERKPTPLPPSPPCAPAPQELTQKKKGCGDASMRKRRAQATSVEHGERESGNQNKGKLSSPRGICARIGWRIRKPFKTRTILHDDHIHPPA